MGRRWITCSYWEIEVYRELNCYVGFNAMAGIARSSYLDKFIALCKAAFL